MTPFTILLAIDLVINGLFAGMCFDVATVRLPTRKRIGALAYAHFARNNDLGNGLKVYPYFFILSGLLSLATAVVAYLNEQTEAVIISLFIAGLTSIGCIFSTSKAAPIMWSLKNSPDDESLLTQKLDKFAFWHGWRTVFQVSTFLLICLALTAL
jgi:hypothetical protein